MEDDALHMDIGTGRALALSDAETQRRLNATTPQWPIMHAQLDGIDRDALMARHKANHVNVVYATNPETALDAALCRAALAQALGIKAHLAGILELLHRPRCHTFDDIPLKCDADDDQRQDRGETERCHRPPTDALAAGLAGHHNRQRLGMA